MTAIETTGPNEITFWGDRPRGDAIPPGYSCLRPGDRFKTRRAKRLAAERGQKVFTRMKMTGRFRRPAAYYVPTEVLSAVEAEARTTEADRAKARVHNQTYRAKAQARDLVRAVGLIRDLFPAIPAGEAERVVAHAYEMGSGRVGRLKALSDQEKAIRALTAHVRHQHTDYEELLLWGWPKADARRQVAGEVEAVLVRWGGEPARTDLP